MTGNSTAARRAETRNVPNPNPHQRRPRPSGLTICPASPRNGSLDYTAGADWRPAARYPIAVPERLDFPADDCRRWAQITFGRQQSSMQRSSKEGGSEELGNVRGRPVALPSGLRPNPDVGLPRGLLRSHWPRISLRQTADLTEQTADFERLPPIVNEIVALWGTRHTIRTRDIRKLGEHGWLPTCRASGTGSCTA
jgi:hypothetical protein